MQNTLRLAVSITLAGVWLTTGSVAFGAQAGSDRFEVTSIKAVRPTLANTVAALKSGDVAGAKAAFDAYDSAWNGVEVYINTRSKELYNEIEVHYQRSITKALEGASPNPAAILGDAQAMLAKFDEAITLVEQSAPLNPHYDDVAHLRIARATLLKVAPALNGGDFDKARKSFATFRDRWPSVGPFIRMNSPDAYTSIQQDMSDLERALKVDKPDVDQARKLGSSILEKYNAIVSDVTKQAREAQ